VLSAEAIFSHATAARLWGMPLPSHLADDVHVVTRSTRGVRRPGVKGWVRAELLPAVAVHGLPVLRPADTWVTLATMTRARGGHVGDEWLVAIGDFLVSGRRVRHGREPALATLDELRAAVRRHGSRRGAARLAFALELIRTPVDSPPETFVRLDLLAAGLPEPRVQPPVATAAGTRHPDLGYLEHRVLIEYLGDVHRIDPQTWRDDLVRVQLFEAAGYRVILAGADDISLEGRGPFAARVRRALRGAATPITASSSFAQKT
jgi:hypothetical protein